jgi:hypothetical protein
MRTYKLPVYYSRLAPPARAAVRAQYVREQNNLCMHCKSLLDQPPPASITAKSIDWSLFPPNFLRHPIHLQHNHSTDLTEGAVHAYCNAVLWQYYGR